MSTKLGPMALTAILLTGGAMADVPNVAVDVAPVHSLIARVMAGVGEPDLIIPAEATPHEYNLRPSDAAALQDADLVVWVGTELAPWFEGAIGTLSGDAEVITLLETRETDLMNYRDGPLFEVHEDGDPEVAGRSASDPHDGELNPHAWLSPDNASAWLGVFAARLAAADPDNADTYLANAAEGRVEMDALRDEISDILDPVRGKTFVVFHDAFQYFEAAFDFTASGAISLGDATTPSPARIAEIRDRVRGEDIRCVLSEPQYNPGLVATVLEGTQAGTGVLDPLGSEFEPGPELYPQLLRRLATTLAECL